MKRNTIQFIIILGAISISGIIIMQLYWMQKIYNVKEKQFHQSVNTALRNVAAILFDYNNEIYTESCDLPYDNPVVKISEDYYVVNVNCEIEADILEHYLVSEFESRDLNIDFEYGIYDCSQDEMIYCGYISCNKNTGVVRHKSKLNKCGEFIYYFGVYFPKHHQYIRGSMDVWYFFAVLLIIILLFFTYSLFVILKQRRLTEIQKDFINNMTHEFKTPISSIALSVEVLANKSIISEPGRIKEYVNIIKNQNIRLQNQVEKILKMTIIDKNKIQLNKKEINIINMLSEIIASFKSSITDKSYTIKTNYNNQIPIFVLADELHFTNIIYNILDNAIKYGKQKVEININIIQDKNNAIIAISDNGIGIKKEHLKNIFNTFYRVPTGNVHNVKGFGLGLSYVIKIIKAHKWKIKVESKLNSGTKFIITLPVYKQK